MTMVEGDRWLLIPGAILAWLMLSAAMLLPQQEYERDYKGALLGSAVAIAGATCLLGLMLLIGVKMGWTTL